MTCNGVAMRRRLTTVTSLPTKACVSRSASAASSGAWIVPVNRTMPFILLTATCAPGIARRNISSMLVRLLPTRTVPENSTLPLVAVANTVVSPGFFAIR